VTDLVIGGDLGLGGNSEEGHRRQMFDTGEGFGRKKC
jgi:hypothetical protein